MSDDVFYTDEEMQGLAKAIQKELHCSATDSEYSTLTSFVLVAEWMSPSGDKWLSRYSGNGAGDPLPRWTGDGLLHYGLKLYAVKEDVEEDDE